MGFTSLAKQKEMGLSKSIFGYLFETMEFTSTVEISDFVQPKIEPEVVFKLRQNLNEVISLSDFDSYVEEIAVGFEIIDSRFKNYKFLLPDVVADATSAAGFVLGSWFKPNWENFLDCTGTIEEDGVIRNSGMMREILGDPRLALVELSEHLASQNESLPTGSVILSGAFTASIVMLPGKVYKAEIDNLRSVSIKVH